MSMRKITTTSTETMSITLRHGRFLHAMPSPKAIELPSEAQRLQQAAGTPQQIENEKKRSPTCWTGSTGSSRTTTCSLF